MHQPLTIHRIFGGRPYAEIGFPTTAVRDERLGLLAIGGALGTMQWPGWDAARGWTRSRVGVYTADGARCHHLLRSHWPVSVLRFHPSLPLLAIGTGGWSQEGELLLLNLDSGKVVSVMEGRYRHICGLRWLDDRTLEVFLAPDDEEDLDDDGPDALRYVIECEDWTAATDGMVAAEELPWGPPDARIPDAPDNLRRELAHLAWTPWAPRQLVWAVEPLDDGRILATLDGIQLECWSPDGIREWAVAGQDGGREILLTPDRRSAWVNTSGRTRWDGDGWHERPYPIDRLSVDGGAVLDTVDPGFAVACVARHDGWLALRDCRHHVERPVTVLVSPGHREAARLELGGYDLFNHHLPVRHSPELLFLQGDPHRHSAENWVVRVDPPDGAAPPQVHRLFPLEWDSARNAHLVGGPAVHLDDAHGPALVHAGTFPYPHGLRPGDAFVTRRRLPDGAPAWVFLADAQATAMDTDGETVYVAYNSGEVVALHAGEGTVRQRRLLSIDGIVADPLSLTVAGPGRLLIGTVDGRIVDCGI
ncbi:hypothetical protein [Streptomyces inhibens]|uniref:hypothetical protein n=1 Tax=Streptomyces inhibens TaxID=2293571 RepID=UPI001EE6CC0E|nr:hypothetical protein [Streptomyces inhibens]UKY47638.1 hypothetical protein KI385_01485 [Streptomyces inhibens]